MYQAGRSSSPSAPATSHTHTASSSTAASGSAANARAVNSSSVSRSDGYVVSTVTVQRTATPRQLGGALRVGIDPNHECLTAAGRHETRAAFVREINPAP